ncbi:MAG: glycerophosphodiester phosphodiesterase, partial [Candidatus Latescibacterota bacterium]
MIPPLRIAHRGASGRGLAPENTLAAFEKALDIGVDMLEIDVRVTGDGQLIVLHDPSLDRTTDCEGIVREMGLDEIRQADAGDGERV